MKPSMNQILMGVAATMSKDVAAHVNEPIAVGHVGTIGLILACVAQETERAAETAILEQDALRALFRDAIDQPMPEELLLELRAAVRDDSRASLKLGDLDAQAARSRELVTPLLAYLETQNFDWAEKLEKRVWGVLKAGAERRALYLPVL